MKRLVLALLWVYQRVLSPTLQVYFGSRCRFTPTCSQYMVQAIHQYGTLNGMVRGAKRLLKCHPWHAGGLDLP